MSNQPPKSDEPLSHVHAKEIAKILDATVLLFPNACVAFAMTWLDTSSESRDSDAPV